MDEKFMRIAIKEAQIAELKDEVPIGAVIVLDGKVIAKAHNKREKTQIATAHAEISCRFSEDQRVNVLYIVDESGVTIECGKDERAYLLPAFCFDGEAHTEITVTESTLTVAYAGWLCRYTVSGRIEDTDKLACNRNGHYRVFLATAKEHLKIRVEILKSP